MLINGSGRSRQPMAVFDLFHQIRSGKILDAVDRRIAQWLEQFGGARHAAGNSVPKLLAPPSHALAAAPTTVKIDVVPLSFSSSIGLPEPRKLCSGVLVLFSGTSRPGRPAVATIGTPRGL